MRLNVFLAKAGATSRRGADELIKSGRVEVNGKTGELHTQVTEHDEVRLDGRIIKAQVLRYILLNKPVKTVTTLKDPQKRRTVTELFDVEERIVPVGRLDYDTTGALLVTNDGELAHKLMHPSFEVDKVYIAEVAGKVSDRKLNMLSNGIELTDGKTAPAKARKLSENRIELIIHEGRNHQVKRMLAAVGLQTKSLHRSKYGFLTVDGLKPGQWRDLEEPEIERLKR